MKHLGQWKNAAIMALGVLIALAFWWLAHMLRPLGAPGAIAASVISVASAAFVFWDLMRLAKYNNTGWPRPLPNRWRWVATTVLGLAIVYVVNQDHYGLGAKHTAEEFYHCGMLLMAFVCVFNFATENPDKAWEKDVLEAIYKQPRC